MEPSLTRDKKESVRENRSLSSSLPLFPGSVMTTANKITITRILLIPVFIILAVYYGASVESGVEDVRLRIAAVAVFILASVSDGLDGYIARHFNQRSRLGRVLDPIADKLLLLAAILTLTFTNWHWSFPLWFPIIVIGRDLAIVGGIGVVYYLNHAVHIQPHWTSKTCTFLQMVAVAWVMLDISVPDPIYPVILAGIFTVISGAVYLVEGVRQLTESGHAHPEKE